MKSTALAVSAIALGVAVLTGCATSATNEPAAQAPASAPPRSSAPAAPAVSTGGDAQPSYRVVRFAFNSSELDEANRKIIEEHARYLLSNPNAKIRLEGHADERGTREYNLALGERRANAVAKVLRVLGVSRDRIETHSWGEEKPVVLGQSESAWAQNRRGEFVYR